LALGGDFGAAWFACLGFILHPLVRIPPPSSSGHNSPLERCGPLRLSQRGAVLGHGSFLNRVSLRDPVQKVAATCGGFARRLSHPSGAFSWSASAPRAWFPRARRRNPLIAGFAIRDSRFERGVSRASCPQVALRAKRDRPRPGRASHLREPPQPPDHNGPPPTTRSTSTHNQGCR